MDKRDWLIKACNAQAWDRLIWRLSIFTVSIFPENQTPEEYDIDYRDGKAYSFMDGDWVELKGVAHDEAIFIPEDVFTLYPDEYPRHKETIKTTVGRYVYNWMVVHYAFGEKFMYDNTGLEPNDFARRLYGMCLEYEDDPLPKGKEEKDVVRPSEVGRFVQGVMETAPMCMGIVPTGTLRSLQTHPDLYKVRDALLEKHKDELDDPAVVVKIQKVLDDLDTEWLEQDQSIDFFRSKKSRMRRRKLLIMHGIESAFREDGKYDLIPTSLIEGGDLTKLVAKFNAVREGSYDRGAETAKGGEQVRIIQMIFQNHKIVPGDCKTKVYHRAYLNELNYKRYIGMNEVTANGVVPLTEERLKERVGKFVDIRRPILCQMPHIDTCAACSSAAKAEQQRAVAADIASGASNVMGAAMSSMHGSDTEVSEFIPEIHIT